MNIEKSTKLPKLLTIQETTDILRISRRYFYELVSKQELKTIRVGNKTYISQTWLEGYLKQSNQGKDHLERK